MIVLLGDIHGDFRILDHLENLSSEHGMEDITVIQVGDFGYYDKIVQNWVPREFPVYFIQGNHEDHTLLEMHSKSDITEVADNLFFIKKGVVAEFGGFKFGFLGGASSIDYTIRLREGYHWDIKEEISKDDAVLFISNVNKAGGIHAMITHTPPQSVIRGHLPPVNKRYWGLPPYWEDTSSIVMQDVWETLGRPMIYCGHIHLSATGSNYRVLDINELYTLPETR